MVQGNIHWIAKLTVGDGKLDTFQELAAGIIAAVQASEPGTLSYEWHITEDGKTCFVDEWYDDTAAAIAHLDGDAPKLLPKLLEVSEFTALEVLSDIESAELKEKLAALGALFTRHSGGFTR